MLYLEDYVELIEHLPVDLRDRFTDMREMDLQVQNTMDTLHDRVKSLFQECHQKKGKTEKADEVFKEIQSEYYKALEDSDEKVQLANQIYDLVDRHLRKLDQELSKFKMELEADNAGITEILERKSLELDNPSNHYSRSSHAHKRKHVGPTATITSSSSASQPPANGVMEKKIKTEYINNSGMIRSESMPSNMHLQNKENQHLSSLTAESEDSQSRPPSRNSISSGTSNTSQNVSGLHKAAAQAVQATAQMQGGRRTSSMKASYEALKLEFPTKIEPVDDELDMSEHRIDVTSEDLAAGSDNSVTSPSSHISRPSRTKKPTSRAAQWTQERMQAEARRGQRERDHHTDPNDPLNESTSSEWPCDPNEPRYCLCNQVSYGEMVGCDNEKCTIEWFHYGCVGLTEAPKGKWYCPMCTQSMKRRNKIKMMNN